ncbi:hypothetical protein NMY22_g19487 [Coprinellus aureogranulatus]|nr:hypothetical protein NMY22_g19487 [Coprinellus aureogranulatus]
MALRLGLQTLNTSGKGKSLEPGQRRRHERSRRGSRIAPRPRYLAVNGPGAVSLGLSTEIKAYYVAASALMIRAMMQPITASMQTRPGGPGGRQSRDCLPITNTLGEEHISRPPDNVYAKSLSVRAHSSSTAVSVDKYWKPNFVFFEILSRQRRHDQDTISDFSCHLVRDKINDDEPSVKGDTTRRGWEVWMTISRVKSVQLKIQQKSSAEAKIREFAQSHQYLVAGGARLSRHGATVWLHLAGSSLFPRHFSHDGAQRVAATGGSRVAMRKLSIYPRLSNAVDAVLGKRCPQSETKTAPSTISRRRSRTRRGHPSIQLHDIAKAAVQNSSRSTNFTIQKQMRAAERDDEISELKALDGVPSTSLYPSAPIADAEHPCSAMDNLHTLVPRSGNDFSMQHYGVSSNKDTPGQTQRAATLAIGGVMAILYRLLPLLTQDVIFNRQYPGEHPTITQGRSPLSQDTDVGYAVPTLPAPSQEHHVNLDADDYQPHISTDIPTDLIQKPHRWTGREGLEVKLGWPAAQFSDFTNLVQTECMNRLNTSLSYIKQDKHTVQLICEIAEREINGLKHYENLWPARNMIIVVLRQTSGEARKNKIASSRLEKENAFKTHGTKDSAKW